MHLACRKNHSVPSLKAQRAGLAGEMNLSNPGSNQTDLLKGVLMKLAAPLATGAKALNKHTLDSARSRTIDPPDPEIGCTWLHVRIC
jgi:hypothetical protein